MALKKDLLRLELESHQLPGHEHRRKNFFKFLCMFLGIILMASQYFTD